MAARAKADLSLSAPAKINLTLEVLGKRHDGFHQVRMLMAGVGLYDRLDFNRTGGHHIKLHCDDARLKSGKGNLVYQAAKLLQKQLDTPMGVEIHLFKKIPLAAGLAGGSSDAAATLVGLNKLWKVGLDQSGLEYLGAQLGSDIPFCIKSGWAIATGRGEKLWRPEICPKFWVVLANPGFGVSTKWAYQNIQLMSKSSKNKSKMALIALKDNKIDEIRINCKNDLETATAGRYVEIYTLIQAMLKNGAITSRMSGSGPTVWGLFKTLARAEKCLKNIKKNVQFAAVAPTLSRIPKI